MTSYRISVEDWATDIGDIARVEPRFEVTDRTIPSAVVDITKSRPLVGPCRIGWRDGLRPMTLAAVAATDARFSDRGAALERCRSREN